MYNDHRQAMAFSLAACGDVPVTIKDPGCTSKTFPGCFQVLGKFTKHWTKQCRCAKQNLVGHVQRRPTDAPVRRCDYGTEVHGRRARGRPRKTLEETLRKDLEYLDLTGDMTQNRAQWRSRIHIADPT
ncbi:hypothetical protein DVH24_026009 [Malus domestica]|uniref:Enolpyruvate transferase domain-containing protein n=1 Tax=Malus domestica TaxID=3750 RepID=A0A498KNI7_MALDO|nr:hypothetical protein DVH24_026009 [Malus domestica]